MKNFITRAFGRFRKGYERDRADSLITAILVFPMVISMIITGIDFGMFLNNQTSIQNAAREGARTVAILGGASSNTNQNRIFAAYGNNSRSFHMGGGKYLTCPTDKNYKKVECNIWLKLNVSPLVQTEIKNIKCAPDLTYKVGQITYCHVSWEYKGLPLSALSLSRMTKEKGTITAPDGTVITEYESNDPLVGNLQHTFGYATSETNNIS